MFIPVGHDQESVRRLPWVTFSMMGLCVAVYLLTFMAVRESEHEISRKAQAVAEYFFQHPETKLPKEIEDLLFGNISDVQDQRSAFKEFLKESSRAGKGNGESLEEQQAKLDTLVKALYRARADSPYYSLGLVPAHQKIFAYITYQFMHAGFWHLFGNMLFLYLAGPYIEDVWGRPLFAAFYLSAGVLSALIYCLKYPEMTGPLVGASGAIAGVMGAFLIRHSKVKINFLFFFFFRPRIVALPAWIMLPLWLAREIFFGQASDYAGGQGGGVAHWAHVAGFAYGVVVALAIRHLDFEKKFVEKKLEQASTVHNNPLLERALNEMWRGDKGHAREMLIDYLKSTPGDIDAAAALWDVSRDIGGLAAAAPLFFGAIREALRKKDSTFVETRWPEVMEALEPGWLDPGVAARVVELLSDSAPPSLIERTVDAVRDQVDLNTAPGLLVRLARSAAGVGAASAGAFASLALENPEIPPDTRDEMQEIVRKAPVSDFESPAAGMAPASEPGAAPDPFATDLKAPVPPIDHQLEVVNARPKAWSSSGKLKIEIGSGKRVLDMQQVKVVAVGGIRPSGSSPFLLIDLLLDAPWSNRRKLRGIRLRSTDFDPRKLVDAPTPMKALQILLEELLKTSEAVPLPNPDAARGRPFEQFGSIGDFEAMILSQ